MLCTYDIGPQTINNQIQLTNGAGDIVADVNANVAVTNTILNTTCVNEANPPATYKGEDTLTGEATTSVALSVS